MCHAIKNVQVRSALALHRTVDQAKKGQKGTTRIPKKESDIECKWPLHRHYQNTENARTRRCVRLLWIWRFRVQLLTTTSGSKHRNFTHNRPTVLQYRSCQESPFWLKTLSRSWERKETFFPQRINCLPLIPPFHFFVRSLAVSTNCMSNWLKQTFQLSPPPTMSLCLRTMHFSPFEGTLR